DHSVLEKEFAPLKAVGELLSDGGLDDTWPCEPDERVGLGDVHVAEKGEAGGDAARGRIEQDADERNARIAKTLARCDARRHLHEAEDALLHARAAGRLKEDDGKTLGGAVLEEACDFFADNRSHRAAHEAKDESAVGDGDPLDAAPAGLNRFLRSRGALVG